MKTIHSFIILIGLFFYSYNASASNLSSEWPEVSGIQWQLKENRISVSWNAGADEPGIFYIIEKSTDGKQYMQAGMVLGGFSHHNQYEFAFRLTHEAGLHYRIKQVNNNGESRLLDSKAF